MSELVERTGVPAATVRYYLVEGLLPPPIKAAANRFLYDERHVEVVRLVRLLRERRGLSLETIGRVLPELLPDLLGKPQGGLFRPEMWEEVLASGGPSATGPSLHERLVEIGTTAFSKRGYGEVTVDDVCRAAAIAKGSFYRQFASKEELFLAVAETVAQRVAASFGAWADGRSVPPERAVPALASAMEPHLVVVLDLTSLAAQRRPGYGRALRSWTATVCDAVRPALARAEGDPAAGRAGFDEDAADEVVARALFEGVRRLIGGDVLLAAAQLEGEAGSVAPRDVESEGSDRRVPPAR
ncbi:MAG: hypothetical protein JWO62_2294 [Acidimicrobiaceae bacterium]|jgi:AcrR family transcriptional regulator|nr:hypothetical protein [Acidimicrobiaceae bacterium]